MLKELEQINKNNLIELVIFLSVEKDKSSFIPASVGELKSDNGYGTKFYNPYNPLFLSISVYTENNQVKWISLIGSFDLELGDFVDLLGDFRKEYSSRDEMFFYFFNEQNNSSPIISVTSSVELLSESKIRIINFRWLE